jgi:hypothetical protein
MSKIFSQQIMMMLGILGIASISIMSVLGVYIGKLRGNFAPYRKPTIIYILISVLVFATIGFAGFSLLFTRPTFTLIGCQIIFFILGLLHINLMHKYLKWSGDDKSFWYELIFTIVVAAFGFMGFIIIFKWMNNEGYEFHISFSVLFFIIAFFVYNTFLKAINIPMKVYNKWYYPVNEELDDPDESKLKNMLVISFEFQKKKTDKFFTNFRAKAPADMEFGKLFYYFINDYNERHPNGKIEFVNEHAAPYGWMFYKKPKWYNFNTKYIETENTFFTNYIRENDVIVCNRV